MYNFEDLVSFSRTIAKRYLNVRIVGMSRFSGGGQGYIIEEEREMIVLD